MKKFIYLIILTSYAISSNIAPKKITNNIYCVIGKNEAPSKENRGNISNSCFIIGEEFVTVIDSGSTFNYAKKVYKSIQNITKKDVKYVINTHYHDDHILGNGFYSLIGATIIGSSSFKNYYKHGDTNSRMFKILDKDTIKNSKIYLPDLEVSNKYIIKNGKESIYIEHLNQAHSDSDLIVKYKDTIFVGDILNSGRVISIRDGKLKDLRESINKIIDFNPKYIVSGHGDYFESDAYKETLEYIDILENGVRDAIENEIEIDLVKNSIDFKEFKNYPLFKELNSQNIYRAYQELEWEE